VLVLSAALVVVAGPGVCSPPPPLQVAPLLQGPVTPAEQLENFDRLLRRQEQRYPGLPVAEWPEPFRQQRRDAEAGREQLLTDHSELRGR
jgi:hypothetical protein